MSLIKDTEKLYELSNEIIELKKKIKEELETFGRDAVIVTPEKKYRKVHKYKRVRTENFSKKWSTEDDARINEMRKDGVSYRAMARELGRSVAALQTRVCTQKKVKAEKLSWSLQAGV